ncbi:SanA/YdcF family protein [Haloferula rosea]|uniref:YdcF family protein n=1 Tax=Haloferula rosea TaxID=490093 RepID=A0A934R9N2_9BACT|nr:ElyC/SanA/YdcF family protein [Haloferula rosea]MBK1826942.1 YdcF family protein [Haloferula rosea]
MDQKRRSTPGLKKGGKHAWKRRVGIALISIGVVGLLAVVWPNVAAVIAGSGKLFDRVSEVPGDRVGLVFGCDDRIQGRENLYFRYRIDAAVELWDAGKLRCIIVSGDNRTKYYNEPESMRRALIERGVPGELVVCDYAGLRTLDSVVRAKEIFGVDEVTFITQRFQNERAAYLAKANDLDFVGYNAKDVDGQGGLKTKLREVAARVKMWLDVRILRTRPKHLGEPERLPV